MSLSRGLSVTRSEARETLLASNNQIGQLSNSCHHLERTPAVFVLPCQSGELLRLAEQFSIYKYVYKVR